jgi:hypothetical protein
MQGNKAQQFYGGLSRTRKCNLGYVAEGLHLIAAEHSTWCSSNFRNVRAMLLVLTDTGSPITGAFRCERDSGCADRAVPVM